MNSHEFMNFQYREHIILYIFFFFQFAIQIYPYYNFITQILLFLEDFLVIYFDLI